ncbi:MAG: CDP-diacylglycerol/serine O-phosphatidyltransferase [Ignavibacteria bacterium]|nr:CDP-diacylglycerol/serine O-phosphatidyltransferase [Ignavibacteria bacterium]
MRLTKSVVPNLLTLANLFCGFTAIVRTANNEFVTAAVFILLAAVFDMLDGVTARLINSTSELGVELDSLCDAVSFGVAPSYMLFKIYFFQFGDFGILIASFPALAGVLRLARFNVQITGFEDKLYFRGLPIPAAALNILSYIIFFHISSEFPDKYKPAAIILVTVTTSLAMVSKFKYENLPRPSIKSFKQRPIFFILFIIALALGFASKGKLIFPLLLVYLFWGAFRHLFYWFKEHQEPEDDIDETEEIDPTPFD